MSRLSERLQQVIDILEKPLLQKQNQSSVSFNESKMEESLDKSYKGTTTSSDKTDLPSKVISSFNPLKKPELPNNVSFSFLKKNDKILFLPKKFEILQNFEAEETLEQSQQHFITKLDENQFDSVIASTTIPFAPVLLQQIQRVLKPNGKFGIQGPKESNFRRSLLFAGFMNIATTNIDNNFCQWVCDNKREIKSVPLKLKQKININSSNNEEKTDVVNDTNVWSFGNTDLMDDNIELIDEDELLNDETEKVVIDKKNLKDDCETGVGSSRKPCKNCTCGRKEEYENNKNDKVTITYLNDLSGKQESKEIPKDFSTGCGNCALGDSFRCSGCPYLGLPPFDPNKKDENGILKLNSTDDIVLFN